MVKMGFACKIINRRVINSSFNICLMNMYSIKLSKLIVNKVDWSHEYPDSWYNLI